jgi:N6-adenosine-specific RNA methylase IME4
VREFHELAGIFPLIVGDDFKALVADVKANGLRAPITLFKEKILDGRNRYRACEAAGVRPRFETYEGDDPLAFVVSANLARRHLNESQRALCAARLGDFRQGGDRSGKQDANLHLAQAADLFKVGVRSVNNALVVKNQGTAALARAVDSGTVAVSLAAQMARKPEAEQRDFVKHVEAGLKPVEAARQVRRAGVEGKVAAMPKGKFRVIYADPPWKYGDSRSQGGAGAAEDHYPTQDLETLKALDVRALAADDAVLLCWATFPLLPDALELVAAWGFAYKTAFVWRKSRGAGLGNYHRAEAELLLVSTRGSCHPDAKERAPQVFDFPRAEHSRKPEEARAMIDRLWKHGPRVELFRRGDAPEGWAVWGAEVR